MARKRGKVQGDNTYGAVHQLDWSWIVRQQPCVKDLWLDCWKAEKFGDSFARLETNVSKNSWTKAKSALSHLFEFRPLCSQTSSGRIQIDGWEVRNLHGSKTGFLSQQMGEENEVNGDIEEALSSPNVWESKTEVVGHVSHLLGEQNAVALDTTAFDSCPIYNNNLTTICNEENEEFSSNERSSRLELEACTKVSASVPSPDAQMTSKENPEVYTDISSINGIFTDNLVENEGSNMGVINTIPPHDGTPQSDTPPEPTPVSEAAVSESPTTPVVAPPVQSQPKVGRPTVKTKPALDKGETVRAYLLAKQKVSEAGLLRNNGQKWLFRFKNELERGVLFPVAEGFKEKFGTISLPEEVLLSDYLFYDPDSFEEPQVCVRQTDQLTLISWTQL